MNGANGLEAHRPEFELKQAANNFLTDAARLHTRPIRETR